MDMTKKFDARNAEKSRAVCEAMAERADTGKRVLTEGERRILDLWPRFEDREPVMPGDKVHYASTYNDETEIEVESITMMDGFFVLCDDECRSNQYEQGQRVKRPTPKVLDADGVHILKGELLYGVGRSGHLFSILDPYHIDPEIGSAFSVRCIDLTEAEECHCKPELLAHAPEVLDADGAPIKVGDTVYERNGQSGIVMAVHPSTRCVDLRQDGCIAYAIDTQRLTCTRPDSWERFVEDMQKSACAYFGYQHKECNEGDGCPAMVAFDCSNCKMADLVRRAKALAGAEAGR